MKKNKHPKKTITTAILTTGATVQMISTSNETLLPLNMDIYWHHVWNTKKSKEFYSQAGQVKKFKEKYR